MTESSNIRIGIMQRVLPSYRVPLFNALGEEFNGNVSVFAGEPRKKEALMHHALPDSAQFWRGKNLHLFDGSFYLCWQSGLMDWLSTWQPQVLIMEANPRYLHSPAAINWMKRMGGKIIGWGLGASLQGTGLFALRSYLRRRFISQFHALITYSSAGAEEYSAHGFPRDRIFIAPNAVAKKPGHPLPERPRKFRAGKATLVFVGRLQERKRVDTLIHACAALPPARQPILWIIGDGPQRTSLESLARQVYPLANFFGAQHGADLENYLRLADLFVLPGTGGLAVQEAMSFGLPVIVGVADGTQSDLVQKENGWMLADETVETLKDTIASALTDISVLRAKGKASYQIVSEEINLEKMVAVFSDAVKMVREE